MYFSLVLSVRGSNNSINNLYGVKALLSTDG